MKMKAIIFSLTVLGLMVFAPVYAQKVTKPEKFSENHSPFGRKKKEKRNQGGKLFTFSFKRNKSHGNADNFASHSSGSKHGIFTRIFKSSNDRNASLRKTKPGSEQSKEQNKLFRRSRSKNKNDHDRVNHAQSKERKKKRVRGNDSFKVKKRQ